MPRPPAVQAPLTNRTFLTTSRSRGYRSKSVAREGGRGKGGGGEGEVSRQELDNGEKPGLKTSQCRKGYEMGAENGI